MPNRMLKESIHTSDKVNAMTDFQFRLWINLITYVDDYGRGDARPAIIRGSCFPLRERITNKDIDVALAGLAGIGCVGLYKVDGRPYLYFPNWEKHQTIRNKRSRFPEPPDDLQAIEINCNQVNANVPVIQSNPIQSETESETESNLSISDEMDCCSPADVQRVIEAWNSLNLQNIRMIAKGSKRDTFLRKRIRDYGIDNVLQAIENVRSSSFLTGGNRKGWVATFDWFILPNNFPKVLDGNYDDRSAPESSGNVFFDIAKEEGLM